MKKRGHQKLPNALIGYTGFVGGNLNKHVQADKLYNSKNINEITGESFDTLYCAGVSAVKWLANKEPANDWKNISILLDALKTVKAKTVILISTVDVYASPINVDETTIIDSEKSEPYGKHRKMVEDFFCEHFPNVFIVRLPGLFGKGLKKNVLFDFLHNREYLANVNGKSTFQFYNLDKLHKDIETITTNNIHLINLATEPISVDEISSVVFQEPFIAHTPSPTPVHYNVKTIHDDIFNGNIGYIIDKKDVLKEIQEFVKSVQKQ